jgi:hypothetical protein
MSSREDEPRNGLRWRVDDHDRRIGKLENYDIGVLANEVKSLERRMDGMTKAAWAVAGSVLVAVVSFALAVASGVIGG